jgi:hypothetical protein
MLSCISVYLSFYSSEEPKSRWEDVISRYGMFILLESHDHLREDAKFGWMEWRCRVLEKFEGVEMDEGCYMPPRRGVSRRHGGYV